MCRSADLYSMRPIQSLYCPVQNPWGLQLQLKAHVSRRVSFALLSHPIWLLQV